MSFPNDSTYLESFQVAGALINYGVLQMKHCALNDAGQTFKIAMNFMKLCQSDRRQMFLQQALKHLNSNCIQISADVCSVLTSVEISFNFFNMSTVSSCVEMSQSALVAISVDTSDLISCSMEDCDTFCAILIYNLGILSLLNANRVQDINQKQSKQLCSQQLFSLSAQLLEGQCNSTNRELLQQLSGHYLLSLAYSNLIYMAKQLPETHSVSDLECRLEVTKGNVHNLVNVVSTTWGSLLMQTMAAAA